MITLPPYMQPTPIKKKVMPISKLTAFLDKEAIKHRKKFRIQNWVVVRLPEPYSGIEGTEFSSNLAITRETMTFLQEQIGVKSIIKVYGINWCIIY